LLRGHSLILHESLVLECHFGGAAFFAG
jgi:hypothetical protein